MRRRGFSIRTACFVPCILAVAALFIPAALGQTAPSITIQPASQTSLAAGEVSFSVAVSGSGPFGYQWQLNGTNLPNNIILTVAGNGTGGFSGDNGPATNAQFSYPFALAVDAAGDLFIADRGNQRIRKIDVNGIITTVAGNGSGVNSGDGGPATAAILSGPYGLAVDLSGNLFIADTDNNGNSNTNHRVREVDINGIITTVAGGGPGAIGGPATNAGLSFPYDVAVSSAGNLFIANEGNNRVLKVNPSGIITTVAGNNNTGGYAGDNSLAINARLNGPFGLAVDAAGNLYIADNGNNRIRKVATNGVITTVAGNGTAGYSGDGGKATNASLNNPERVAVDAARNLYIADSGNDIIRKVGTNGIITTVAGVNGVPEYAGDGGAATNAFLYSPTGVAVDAVGNLFIADTLNNRVREVALAGLPFLTLSNIPSSFAGNYQVIITSPSGSVTSAVATLTVIAPPVIVTQPADVAPAAGSTAALSVEVLGAPPLFYSWYFNGTNLLAAGTNSVLSLANVGLSNVGGYDVVVTNVFGSVTSRVAGLVAGYQPMISGQPEGQTVMAGDNAIFLVAPAGVGPFSYQWQFNGINLPNDIITTVAGETGDLMDDGGLATDANIRNPTGLAVDASGNLYIADYYNNRIRKVDTNGIITSVAGNGSRGYSGDGGAAINAALNYPSSVKFDVFGNLFIGDSGNNRVRKVDTNGIIITVAGTGAAGYSGNGGVATKATLNFSNGPWADVAVDASGNLYIADSGNFVVRKVGVSGIITTVAGNGNFGFSGFDGDGGPATGATFNGLMGVAVDTLGDLFISDANNVIRQVDTNGIITTVVGRGGNGGGFGDFYGDGGPATNASIGNPLGLTFDSSGNLFIADFENNRVRKVDMNGIITTVAGDSGNSGFSGDNDPATRASLSLPCAAAVDASGNLFIADMLNSRVRKVDLKGIITTVAGNGTEGLFGDYASATEAGLFMPSGVAVDGFGNLFIADSFNNRVRQVDTNGIITTAAGSGTGVPRDGLVSVFSYNGMSLSGDGGAATNAGLSYPSRLALDDSGNIFIGDTYNNRIRKVDAIGTITTVAGGAKNLGDGNAAIYASLGNPDGVAVDAFANLFIADTGRNRIRKVGADGIIYTVAGNGSAGYTGDRGSATNAELKIPNDVAVDASGNFFIADSGNETIRKVGTNGIITTVAGTGALAGYAGDGAAATKARLNTPSGVVIDTAGNLYIADSANNRIRRVGTNGIITTVAGNGVPGGSGDGGAATNASLDMPSGLSLDRTGNLYIADSYNNRVREVLLAGLPALNLNNVTAANGGNYQVIVTSPYGSVTSVVARLTVAPGTNLIGTIVMGVPAVTVNNLILGFSITPALSVSFTLLQAANISGPWTTNSAATLTTTPQPGGYQFTLPAPNTVEFFQVRSP